MYTDFLKAKKVIERTENINNFTNFILKSSGSHFTPNLTGSEYVYLIKSDDRFENIYNSTESKINNLLEIDKEISTKNPSRCKGDLAVKKLMDFIIGYININKMDYKKFFKTLNMLYKNPSVYSAVVIYKDSDSTDCNYNLFSINPVIIKKILNVLLANNIKIQIAINPKIKDDKTPFSVEYVIDTLKRNSKYNIESNENKVREIFSIYRSLLDDQVKLMSSTPTLDSLIDCDVNGNNINIKSINVVRDGDYIREFIVEIDDDSIKGLSDIKNKYKYYYISTDLLVMRNGTVIGDYGFILTDMDMNNRVPKYYNHDYCEDDYAFDLYIAKEPNITHADICTGSSPKAVYNLGVMKDKNYRSPYRSNGYTTLYNYIYGKINQEYSLKLYMNYAERYLTKSRG